MLNRSLFGRTTYARTPPAAYGRATLPPASYLMVPGLGGSGPDHWQTQWEHNLAGCSRVQVGDWNAPSRSRWVAGVGRAVEDAVTPVVVVGHSLGCLAIALWASDAPASLTARVAAALLVAPPDIEQQGVDLRLMRFGPVPVWPLPFATLVVASGNDPFCSSARARALADAWRADCVDIGRQGHINAGSGLGDWHLGQALLADMLRRIDSKATRRG